MTQTKTKRPKAARWSGDWKRLLPPALPRRRRRTRRPVNPDPVRAEVERLHRLCPLLGPAEILRRAMARAGQAPGQVTKAEASPVPWVSISGGW